MPEAPKLPDDWTEPERWAWQQIAAGKVADFNAQAKSRAAPQSPSTPSHRWLGSPTAACGPTSCNTSSPTRASSRRRLSAVSASAARSSTMNRSTSRTHGCRTNSGWRIRGSRQPSRPGHPRRRSASRWRAVTSLVPFNSSVPKLPRASIWRAGASFGAELDLTSATIEGQLDMTSSRFAGPVSAERRHGGGRGLAVPVDLRRRARPHRRDDQGQLEMSVPLRRAGQPNGTTFDGRGHSCVDGAIFQCDSTSQVRRSRVNFDMSGSHFAGPLSAEPDDRNGRGPAVRGRDLRGRARATDATSRGSARHARARTSPGR